MSVLGTLSGLAQGRSAVKSLPQGFGVRRDRYFPGKRGSCRDGDRKKEKWEGWQWRMKFLYNVEDQRVSEKPPHLSLAGRQMSGITF